MTLFAHLRRLSDVSNRREAVVAGGAMYVALGGKGTFKGCRGSPASRTKAGISS
jgi:hypothetical protein